MKSTHDHDDHIRYWLTDAIGDGQPIPDKVFRRRRRYIALVADTALNSNLT